MTFINEFNDLIDIKKSIKSKKINKLAFINELNDLIDLLIELSDINQSIL